MNTLQFDISPHRKVAEKTSPVVERILEKPKHILRKISTFALSGLILILILQGLVYLSAANGAKGEILGAATTAYDELHTASKDLANSNFSAASGLFVSAQNNIRIAQEKLNNFEPLKWLAPEAQSADHILKGAYFLAQAGQKLSMALSLFEELKVSSKGVETSEFNQKILSNRQLLSQSRDYVLQASNEFSAVGSVPLDYAQTLEQARQQVSQLDSILQKIVGLEDLYLSFFSGQKTNLLIFQNYNEARATGGFIGTYGVIKTDNGSIKQLKIESIYNLDGRITAQIAAPGPMHPVITKWGIRDANWFADFPTSAEKLLYFFELGSQTADGVISFTPQMFEDLLKLVGPVEMPAHNVTLTSDNFQDAVQYKTSIDYNLELNQPKKLLADAAPILLDRLVNLKRDAWFDLFQIFQDNLQQRQILLYSKNQDTQAQIENLGFSGKILTTEHDYLNIVNSNLGGTKTDLSVAQSVNLKSKILSDGSVINTLTIKRKNTASDPNRDFMRVLVPLGSEYISSAGFDQYDLYNSTAPGSQTDPDLAGWDQGHMMGNVFIRTEAGKTEFTGWLTTQAGQERSVTVTYILPFRVSSDSGYSLLLQKQSGSKAIKFEGELILGNFKAKWLGPSMQLSGNKVLFGSDSNTDDFWPLVITQ